MKKIILSSVILAAGIATADTLVLEDDFSSYSYGPIEYKGPWASQSEAYVVTNNPVSASNSLLVAKGYRNIPANAVAVSNLLVGETVRITLDHQIVQTNAQNRVYIEFGLKDTDQNWKVGWDVADGWPASSGSMVCKIDYNNYLNGTVKYWPNGDETSGNENAVLASLPENAGFQPNGGNYTSDLLRVTYSITKQETEGEFQVSAAFSNLNGSAILKTTPANNVVNTNAWNDDEMFFFIRSVQGAVDSAKPTDFYVDYVKVEQLEVPRDVVLWEDDFNSTTAGQEIQWRTGWIGNNNNAGWIGTADGTMVQRPNISTNKSGVGYRGAVYNGAAFEPQPGDTMIVEFDWRLFTDSLKNSSLLDINMQTNASASSPNPAVYYNGADSAMSFRLSQSAWTGDGGVFTNGQIQIRFAEAVEVDGNENSLGAIEPSLLGLAPAEGDQTGDVVRVTYALEKTTNLNVWTVSLTLSNKTDSAKVASFSATVTNAAYYNQSEFYFSSIVGDNLLDGVEGNEFDNFVGILRAPYVAPLEGYDLFVDMYGLSGVKTDDFDSDGLNDWGEYVFGGDPTDDADLGVLPAFDGSNGGYAYSLVGDNTVVAHIVTTDDLMNSAWVTNETVYVSEMDGAMHAYESLIDTSADKTFIQILVE